jgi:hypothetical protein
MDNYQTQNEDPNQISLTDLGISTPQIESVSRLPSAHKGTAASSKIRYKDFGTLTLADYEIFSKLPEHPFWSQVDRLVDFTFADELCAHLYSPNGQRPFAPSLKLKLHLVQAMENLSDREMEVRLMFDIAIKRFVGVPMAFAGFDHSTLGLNRERMGDRLFHACFHYVLAQLKPAAFGVKTKIVGWSIPFIPRLTLLAGVFDVSCNKAFWVFFSISNARTPRSFIRLWTPYPAKIGLKK